MNNYVNLLKKAYGLSSLLSKDQWKELHSAIREEVVEDIRASNSENGFSAMREDVIRSITIDELRIFNPNLYQEIVEDILRSNYIGRKNNNRKKV